MDEIFYIYIYEKLIYQQYKLVQFSKIKFYGAFSMSMMYIYNYYMYLLIICQVQIIICHV